MEKVKKEWEEKYESNVGEIGNWIYMKKEFTLGGTDSKRNEEE